MKSGFSNLLDKSGIIVYNYTIMRDDATKHSKMQEINQNPSK